jgi:erythronate-4-phosphate dehydrogenase
MLKVFADSNIPYLEDALKSVCELYFFDSADISNQELIDTDILFNRTALKVNQDLLAGTSVKFTATATSGIDHYDLKYLDNANIAYANALGSNANSVAEYVMYAIAKHQIENAIDMSGKTIGIIGCGSVGSIVARYALKAGFKVLINDPPKIEAGHVFPDEYRYRELDELIVEADIITNHVPRTYDGKHKTINLLNADNLELIKENALFIHASRGKVVDETAFIKVADSKRLTSVFDVWSDEPLFNHTLAKKCLLATPHIAGHSLEGKVLGTKMVLDACREFFEGTFKPDYTEINQILHEKPVADDTVYRNIEELYGLLKSARKLEEDHDFMCENMEMPANNQGKAFLNYRQKYPVRRESL